MQAALNYWIATVDLQNWPHVTPVWGVWVDETFYFDGSPATRRGRNLAANPNLVVHLENGTQVVILQGQARMLRGSDNRPLAEKLAQTYTAKYAGLGYSPSPDTWDQGGLYVVQPRVVLAWTKFPQDATRWTFSDV